MGLETTWFVLIAVLWGGYFVLEGFDFGVSMLLPFVARSEPERRALLETVEPVWDGNEVWLVVAAGATFAAFPVWYATMFSGFYLVLLVILLGLIVRAVSFEWRGRGDGERWKGRWLAANVAASYAVPFLWGLALANLLWGVPLDGKGHYAGSVGDLFSPYTVAAGVVVVALFAFHGATFLGVRLAGELAERVGGVARRLAVPVAVAGGLFEAWTVAVAVNHNAHGAAGPAIPALLGAASLMAAAAAAYGRRSRMAFALTALAAVAVVATLFTSLYPRVLVSDPAFANSLTVQGAAAEHYALKVITIVAAVFTPLVLLYQGWTYHVFRARVRAEPS